MGSDRVIDRSIYVARFIRGAFRSLLFDAMAIAMEAED
jgi:hypothetical protein